MITLSLQWRIAGDDGNKGKEEFQVGEGRRERKEVYVWPCSSEQPERTGRGKLGRPAHARQEGLPQCADRRALFGRDEEKPLRFSSGQLSG